MASLDEYREMAKDWDKHLEMLKDQSCMDFLVYSLDTEDDTVMEKTLDIIKLFIENEKTHSMLKSYLSLVDNIKLIDKRNNISSEVKDLAREIYSKLYSKCNSSVVSSPAKSPFSSVQNTHVFHIEGLYSQNEVDLERTVIRLRGVISIQTDVEHQRCVVRTMPTVDQYKIAQRIVDTTRMKPRLITRNKNQQEIFVDILTPRDSSDNISDDYSDEDLPAYLPEEDEDEEAYHPKSVLSFQYIRDNASSIIHSAARIINAFYC